MGADAAPTQRRLTKLVCTLGPAVQDRIPELVDAGMDVARLNFSHGSMEQRSVDAASVRQAAANAGRPVAVLADLAGPKIRIGDLEGGAATLVAGGRFVRAAGRGTNEAIGDAERAGVTYERLPADARSGDTILLGDGVAELLVESVVGNEVRTSVVRGGTIRSRTGVAIPSDRLSLQGLTDKDRLDARAAVDLGVDFVAQSFVRGPEDIRALRDVLGPEGPPIIAKIETRPAVDRFDDIVDVVDAVMVARGDLGVELPYEEVPIVQKQLVSRALERGVPTIVATQMLESMISAPRPTRAEASDVANAVFDGADAIMLSAETAIGRYPVLAAEAAVRIIRLCEARGGEYLRRPDRPTEPSSSEALVIAAVALADADPEVDAIACVTRTGRTARLLATMRPSVPIFAFVADPRVATSLALVHGVVPMLDPGAAHGSPASRMAGGATSILDEAAARLAATGQLPPGATVVLVGSADEPGSGPTLLELQRLPTR